ncbi:SPOR domain-containing protein [Flavobacterium aquatile]|uniref:Sporulation protein n=1 Tax=Flavobacterium aquatile LMG 4008 = ATCC 11947 TaxID=1453498 RepID=A0A095V2W8_9FLAO|nr:SPOR domain-containing protein [Flavobacterium aquatile]KGD69165.1 sporulation protein [Flavobacterium aquatile LMG 4008 = ATCC 11947]OXA65873.1 SPOR domain-containing protein [Flavobacterium aquatile LMG 4008 = ATCC 11947]
MNYLSEKRVIYSLLTFIILNSFSTVNAQSVTVSQDDNFEQLLNEKRRINSSITINNRYKIQIFNGNSESSKKALIDFKREFKNYDATIIFSTPAYKVIVGNFKTRIEAERNLNLVRKKYPNSILIKPSK